MAAMAKRWAFSAYFVDCRKLAQLKIAYELRMTMVFYVVVAMGNALVLEQARSSLMIEHDWMLKFRASVKVTVLAAIGSIVEFGVTCSTSLRWDLFIATFSSCAIPAFAATVSHGNDVLGSSRLIA
jgi:hypothetical protein